MPEACATCGGTGRGRLIEGQGWVAGDLDDEGQPAPCPDCEVRFEEVVKKTPESLTIRDANGKVTKQLDPETLTLGLYMPAPKARPSGVRTETLAETGETRVQKDEGTDARGAGFSESDIERSAR